MKYVIFVILLLIVIFMMGYMPLTPTIKVLAVVLTFFAFMLGSSK